jgi:hypothetical protein
MASDAQWVLDIAAQLDGAEPTIAQLDRVTAQLMGAGKGASHFQDALAQVTNTLTAATDASAAANDALKTGKDEYRLLEKAALQASKSAEKAAVKNRGVIPPELASEALAAGIAVEKMAAKMRGLESNASKAEAAEKALGVQLSNVRRLSAHADKSIARQSEGLARLQSGLGQIGGPLGRLGQMVVAPAKGFADMSQSIGTARAAAVVGVVGVVALVAAVVALSAAAVAGVAAIGAWAVKLGDARRSADLTREAFEAMHPELVALRGDFSAIVNSTGMGEAALRDLAKSLKDAKVAAVDMPAALHAAALAETALGKGGASEFIADIKAGKLAVRDFASETEAKLGGVVARQMLGLESQGARLRNNFGKIFGGMNIDPALEGLRTLVELFDENTVAGRAIKFLFESVFQPLINQAQNAAYVVEAFALGFLIGLTKVYIAVKPAIQAIEEFFGFKDNSLLDVLTGAKDAGEFAAKAFVVLAAAFAVVVGVVGVVVGVLVALGAVVVDQVVGAVTKAVEFVRGIVDLWRNLGSAIMTGLSEGIGAGAGAVLAAITGAVKGAISAAKRMLGIASPSKVFADIGVNTGAGFEEGVEQKVAPVQSAMSDLLEPPDPIVIPPPKVAAMSAVAPPPGITVDPLPVTSTAPPSAPMSRQDVMSGNFGPPATYGAEAPSAPAPAPAAPAPSGASVNLQGATFVFNGVADAEQAEQRFEEMLTRMLEGDAAAMGAA